MPQILGKEYDHISRVHLEELRDLEKHGYIITQFYHKDEQEFKFCKIEFTQDELVKYADSLKAYDEYLGYLNEGFDKEESLSKLSDDRFEPIVKEYNEHCREVGQPEVQFAPAAFFLDDLESLVCGTVPERYDWIDEDVESDRRYILSDIVDGIHESSLILRNRNADRPNFEITCEQDVQDLLHALLKPIFPDVRGEEWTPKHGTKSKRIDFVIPSISTIIETKYMRDSSHANSISDELKTDIQSYHSHEQCNRIYGIIWDDGGEIIDRSNFENELSGSQTIDGTEFDVKVLVLP